MSRDVGFDPTVCEGGYLWYKMYAEHSCVYKAVYNYEIKLV